MKLSKMTLPLVVLSLATGSTLLAQSWGSGGDEKAQEQKVKLLGTIAIPGSPIPSTDIVWADQTTGDVLVSDRSNAGVDVIDGNTDLFVGRVSTNKQPTTVPAAAAGTLHFQGLTSPSTHEGPNGEVTTPDKRGWAGDGDSTVKVIDLDPSSPTYLQILASISTAMVPGFTNISNCTGGPTGSCNRADEIGYDPEQNIIAVANDEPNGILPYLTFIDASFPYTVLGQINFSAQSGLPLTPATGAAGLEQPVWDPGLHSFLQTLPTVFNPPTAGTGAIVEFKVNPSPFSVTIEKTISMSGFDCSPTGEALGEDQHLVVSCGSFPLVIDVSTGNELGAGINQVGGGDEVNFNPGENEFVVSSGVDGPSTNPTVLGVINGKTGDWIENAPGATLPSGTTPGSGGVATAGRAGNLAALGSNNHVFVVVHPAASPATDICGTFTAGTTTADFGCVAVFGPVGSDKDRKDDDHGFSARHDDDGFGGPRF